jgi:hypothetical protein
MSAQEKVPDILMQLDRCKDWIEAALEYGGGTHNFSDVVEGVLSAKMQLWVGETGCAVTEIIVYPRKKVLHVFLAGGEMSQIIDFQESAAEFGRMNGCTAMTLAGRRGWKKVLNKHDWEESLCVMSKEL